MTDVIFISQSQMVRFEEYDKLPLDRMELFRNLVQLRSVYLDGGFRSHLDVLNLALGDPCFHQGSDAERRKLLDIWHLPGLNGVLVASQLLDSGFSTKVINHFDAEWDRLVQAYEESSSPPLVAISTTFHLSWAEVKRITKRLLKLDPDMKILVGGAFANERTINGEISEFEKPMRKYGISYLLHGFNSESDFMALVTSLRSGDGLETVPNLAWIDEGDAFRSTEKVWQKPTLGERSVLWDQLDLPFLNKTVQLRTASGCPFECAFCSYPKTDGGHFAGEVGAIEAEFERIASLPGIEQVIFIDDTFNVPIGRFKKILRLVERYSLQWYSFLRFQYIDEEQTKMMKDSGCVGVYLGLESANDAVLANMNKRATRAQFQRGVSLLKKYEIPMLAAFVLGFPGETEETVEENVKFIEQNEIEFYSLKEFYYMPHTSVHTKRLQFGLKGMGNEWRHNTMTSERATELKLEVFGRVKNSIYIDADTSLWYIAYLRDQGYSLEQIKASQSLINQMMARDNADQFHDKADLLSAIQKVLLNRTTPVRRGAPAPASIVPASG